MHGVSDIKSVDRARQALTYFKTMAVIVGIGLLILCAELVLRYGFHNHILDFWPQPHGFLYILYVFATANLGFKVGWSLSKMVLVMLAGVVPFLSFWAEQRVAQEVEGRLEAAAR
jgi:integral membrane protein